jgi:hypothetical protein
MEKTIQSKHKEFKNNTQTNKQTNKNLKEKRAKSGWKIFPRK